MNYVLSFLILGVVISFKNFSEHIIQFQVEIENNLNEDIVIYSYSYDSTHVQFLVNIDLER